MAVLRFLERLRAPWLDRVMLLITQLGGETVFIALAIIVFWCVGKRQGYYLLTVGFLGTVLNQFLKLACRVSRPWVRDPSFTIVEAARAGATGYSFPSGHTQNAAATLGCPALLIRKKGVKALLWTLYALVALSRMYLGVHTPWDVGVGLASGLALLFALRPFFETEACFEKSALPLLLVLTALAAAFAVYARFGRFPADIEADNLASAQKNAGTLLGAVAGMLAARAIDRKFLHFSVRGSLAAQCVKCAAGLALTMALRVALKPLFALLPSGAVVADAARYFLVVLFAAGIWPAVFPWICKKFPA